MIIYIAIILLLCFIVIFTYNILNMTEEEAKEFIDDYFKDDDFDVI
ncbi:hypothetical protein [Tenacibaculum sp. M341]|nr:hypothetical protein [Tenacibaculum sp. M341]